MAIIVALWPFGQTEEQPIEGFHWQVRTIPIRVLSYTPEGTEDYIRYDYCLYYGDQLSQDFEEELGKRKIMVFMSLLHPVPGVDMKFDAPERWYVTFIDTRMHLNVTKALFDPKIWPMIPDEVKQVLVALDYRNNIDLLVVNYNIITGSIGVYFHPRFNESKLFYKWQLRKIQRYLRKHPQLEKDLDIPTQKEDKGPIVYEPSRGVSERRVAVCAG